MKRNSTKKALITSVLSLLLCMTMLVGSTFAWFTDSASTGINTIIAGNLDVGLEYSSDMVKWQDAEASTEIFDATALWEPGYTEVVYFRVKNLGNLAFRYRIGTNLVRNELGVNKDGKPIDLTQYIQFAIIPVTEAFSGRDAALAAVKNPIAFGDLYTAENSLDAKNDTATFAMVVYMPTGTNNDANHNGTDIPSVEFGVQVVASQKMKENDSFGNQYDQDAAYPNAAFTTYRAEAGALIFGKGFEATIPANAGLKTEDGTAIADGTDLVMQIAEKDAVDSNVTVTVGEVAETYEITLTTTTGEKVTAQEPITVELNIGKGRTGTISLYHKNVLVEGTSYDPETGMLTFATTSFSPYTVVETVFRVETDWYDGAKNEFTLTTIGELYGFSALVNSGNNFVGKTVKLGADIDLNHMAWTPIGKGNTNSFQGVFDGQGHTISNLNAVTASGWYNGLFGYVKNLEGNPAAAVKNVAIHNAKITGNAVSSAVVVGEVFCATVENVTVKGNVTVNGGAYTGGIVGKGYAGIINCHIEANEGSAITANSSYLGGIIGHRGEGSSYDINGCSVKNVTITGSSIVGGVAGISQAGNKITSCTLENVTIVYKNVSDPADYTGIGAFSGWSGNNVAITGCSFTGTIETPHTLHNDKVTGLGYNGATQSGLVLQNNTVTATVIGQ